MSGSSWGAARRIAVALVAVISAFGALQTPTLAASDAVSKVSAGGTYTCAVKGDGSAWCWGDDYFGELGDGSTGDAQNLRLTPVRVRHGGGNLSGVSAISAGGDNTCAVKSTGSVWCWGWGQYGANGDGTTTDRHTAVHVKSSLGGYLTDVTQVAMGGGDTACARRTDGTVWCWGSASDGQTGDGTTGDANGLRLTAVQVRRGSGFLTGITQISSNQGDYSTCARRKDGTAWCWGEDQSGELGDGTTGNGDGLRLKAVQVKQGATGMTDVSSVAVGAEHACAVKRNGSAWCWGSDGSGELGDGTTGDPSTHLRLSPVKARSATEPLANLTAGSAGGNGGGNFSCVRRSDATAWCWGADSAGELGDGTTGDVGHVRLTAVEVRHSGVAFANVKQVSAGSQHTCAVRTNGTLWCWGANAYGQLGIGSADASPHPAPHLVTLPAT